MKLKKIMLSVIIVFTSLLSQQVNAQDTTKQVNKNKMAMEKMSMGKHKMHMDEMTMPDLKTWPEASQKAAKEMMDKYGKPNATTPHMLVWHNNGPWKKTIIYDFETKHLFPVDHTDVMEQVINYKVPANKFSDLAEYDGSVSAQRTDGVISAICDFEGANFLALNLAHDVLTGKKTVQDARDFYTKTIKEFVLEKKTSPYMQSFQFIVSNGDTGFTDENSVSKEVMEEIMKAKMKLKMEMKDKM